MGSLLNEQEARELLDGFGKANSLEEAELRGMQRMLSLVCNSGKRDFPTLVGRMRRVIEAAREETTAH
jgi:hypothetical protein